MKDFKIEIANTLLTKAELKQINGGDPGTIVSFLTVLVYAGIEGGKLSYKGWSRLLYLKFY